MTTVVAISELFARVCCVKRNTSNNTVLMLVDQEDWWGKFTVNSSQWAGLANQGKEPRRLACLLRIPRTPALLTVNCSL